jgi:drug/metabolite transporter (DMT)-like permease
VAVAASCVGLLGPLSRLAYEQGVTPFAFIVWRGLIGCLALALIVALRAWRGAPPVSLRSLPWRERRGLVAAGICGLALNITLFVAYQRLPIAIALLIFYTYPVLIALYGAVTHTERVGVITVAALGLALAGMVLVVGGRLEPVGGEALDPLGIVLAFGAAIGAASWIGIARTFPSVPVDQAMGLVLSASVAGSAVISLVADAPGSLGIPFEHGALWPYLLVSGVVAAALSSVLFVAGTRLITRVRTAVLALFEPVVGVSIAAVVLGESLVPVQLVGGLLVLAAAVLVQTEPGDRAPGPASVA